MFDRKKDLVEQYTIIKKLFAERYDKLSNEERNDVRQAILDIEHLISNKQCFREYEYSPYKFIYGNAHHTMVPEKMLEFIDKLTASTENLTITKTRNCGVTDTLLTFVMWICLNKIQTENRNIWFISPKRVLSEESMLKFMRKVLDTERQMPVCNKDMIEFNGWKIFFTPLSSATNKMVGIKPHLIIMDECAFETEKKLDFENKIIAANRDVRTIKTITRKNDEANRSVGWSFGYANKSHKIDFVNIQWFHDLNKCKGLRFERVLDGVQNTIQIAEDDIPTVVGNDDYLYKMFKEGWRLNSDWLVTWDKYTKCESDDDDQVEGIDEISDVEVMSAINNAVMDICKKDYSKMQIDNVISFFKDCWTTDDVDKIKKKLLLLFENRSETKKNEDLSGYINLIKDIFEL